MYDSPLLCSSLMTLMTLMLAATAACGASPASPPSEAATSSGGESNDASTTDDPASTSSTGDDETGGGSSSGTTGSETGPPGELLECFEAESLVVRPDALSDHEQWYDVLSNTRCTLQDQEWSQDELGRARTDITLFCDTNGGDPGSDTDTDTDAGTDTDTDTDTDTEGTTGEDTNPSLFDISIIGATIDLGRAPVEVSFHYDMDEDHMFGSDAEYRFSVRRGEQLLLVGDDSLSQLGGTQITGDTVCSYYGYDCGFRLGVEGTGPDGEALQVLTGEPTEFLVEGESLLVAVEGISPQDCPDGTEPYDPSTRMDVSAINTALLVRD